MNIEKKKIEKKYLVPNAITIMNLFLGYCSIIMSFKGEYDKAAWLIFAAVFCDVLDGKMARKLNAFSEFGKELDSFCDATSFGIAPGILAYSLLRDLHPMKELALPFSFLFILCGILRLVKFNIITEASETKADFIGMPIPTAAGIIFSYYLFSVTLFGELRYINVFLGLLILSSILMVSLITFKTPGKVFTFIPKKLMMPFALIIIFTAQYSLFPFLVAYVSLNVFHQLQEWTMKDQINL